MNANVRTFRAADPRGALAAVKAAFGADAVILSTREVSGGLFGKPEIEVTAASGADAAPPKTDAPARREVDAEIAALRRVIEDLREEMRARREDERGAAGVPPAAVRVLRRLVERGVEGPIAEEIVKAGLRDAPTPREPDLWEAVRALLRRRLPPARAPWERGERRLLALIGPTGVGKTTTIAKIAARALLEARLKVALVTVDTYRIGATEHIGRYGEIMGVPTHVARDASALASAIARTAEAELVLIDTAGRSDAAAIAGQAELLRTVPDVELHLCLPAAAGPRELRAAAKRYERCRPQRLIFTKLDEADGPGGVLSAAAAVAAPISCVTDGQRVPEDLHPGAGPRLLDVMLGS